jgi:hypothetical protein
MVFSMSKSTNLPDPAKNSSDLPPAVKGPPKSCSALLKTLGAPIRPEANDAQVWHWTAERAPADGGVLHKDGDGILVLRRASLDPPTWQSSEGEIDQMLEFTRRRHLRPREIIVCVQSGCAELERRWDLDRITSEVRVGNLKWVAYSSTERVGRSDGVFEQFLDILIGEGVDLFLTHTPDVSAALLRDMARVWNEARPEVPHRMADRKRQDLKPKGSGS